LIPSIKDSNVLICPQCGISYSEKDTASGEPFMPKFGSQPSKIKIITGKMKMKYYDQHCNEINDPNLLHDIAKGATVISYHEQTSGENNRVPVKKF
jgi:hypothetical protein